ncbi:potassium voltage-gated channel protein Shaw-like [Littorina saxatilis]|uniref:potassium voltage-gated channel protein Shaw-like n=1 Tax=Littorina saxatilis TaxID=31220 RepID=UPI0038B4ACA9
MFVSAAQSMSLPTNSSGSDLLFQRRPSFPQSSSGDWRSKHNNGKPAPTASSMAEMQYEEEDAESITTPTSTTFHHAPHCRCAVNNNLTIPGTNSDGNGNNGNDGGGGNGNNAGSGSGKEDRSGPGDLPICTCQMSYVTLGGVTSPDGSKTSLSTAVTNNNKKHRRPRGAKPTVIFNVGGQTFETYRSTLKRFKNSFFADDDKMRAYFRPAQGDYFFDRDPTAFGAVLNYLRTGDLHVPTTMCGPALQAELEFWSIDELDIERCCWTQYNTWKTQSRSLEKLEYDRKFSTTQNQEKQRLNSDNCWERKKAKLWQFLQDPGSSRAAKVYAWVSIIFVFVSIFSFCADTHPLFRVNATDVDDDFASFYRFFNLEFVGIIKDIDYVNNNTTITTTGSYNESGAYNETAGSGESLLDEEDERMRLLAEEDLPHPSLLVIDLCCLIFFTLEYMTRFVCAPSKANFLRSFQNVIDFVAISPDYVELLFLIFDPVRREGMAVMDLMVILRMLRLCRIFRLIRHVPGLWILLYTLKASFNELMLMFVFLLIGMVVFATLMHFAEGANGFPNIPVGFWWSVVTMTTVGYGDMVPQTAAGYVIGSCCAVAGLLMIAFTVPIIVSNFVLYYTHVQYGLARRDREIERLDEDVTGHSDEENQLGAGDRADSAERKLPPGPVKEPPDAAAIALGENIALTDSSAAASGGVGTGVGVYQNHVRFQDESPRTADPEAIILV